MTNIIKRHVIRLPLLFTVLSGCYSSKIPLTPEEERFSKVLAGEYQCELSMQHDYNAIRKNRKDGAFWIAFKNSPDSLCSKDSTFLKHLSSGIAQRLAGVITHRENYSAIQLEFITEKQVSETGYHTLCTKRIQVNIKDMNDTRVVYWQIYKNSYKPSDHIIER